MKINIPLLLVAVFYNLVNYLFWQHITKMPDATSMIYVIIFPCFWIITFITVLIISIKNKAVWFSKEYILSTVVGLIFCTPIPMLSAQNINAPESYNSSTSYESKDGYTIKRETWMYYSGKLQVIKYWKATEENCNNCDTSQFKKDSTWIYFNESRDTTKVEMYRNGKLIN